MNAITRSILLLGLSVLVSMLSGGLPARAATSVFINEIHYDNSGSDTGEAIEIAGPAGTDLAGWSLELYNGSSTQLKVYDTIALSGTISDQQSGFGTLSFFRAGIQNGAPDGVALLDSGDNVVQFLSYEGSFTAAEGPAAGMTSTDIGVSEGSGTPVGFSLQLTGSGNTYEEFSWAGPADDSFGAVNSGQTFVGSGDTAPTVAGTDPANGATDVAVEVDIVVNFSEAVTVAGNWFQLDCGVSGLHDINNTSVSGGPVSYTIDPNADFSAGETCSATIFATQVTDQDGPADAMASNYVFGFTVTAPMGEWIINEIHADPDASNGDANGDGVVDTSDDEFVEIVNNTDSDVDLTNWTLSDNTGVRYTFPGGTIVPAHCALVIFADGTPTGSFGRAIVQTVGGQLGLNNGGDTLTLTDSGSLIRATATYGSEGGNNQSLTRDPDLTGAFVQHTSASGSGGALFSPGTKLAGSRFAGCPVPIHEIQGSGGTSPMVGQTVLIQGIVTGDFQDGDADNTRNLRGFYVQEENTDADPLTSEGLFVFDSSTLADVNPGDKVRVTGVVQEFYDETQLQATDVVVIGAGSIAPTEVYPTTLGTVLNYDGEHILDLERYEGMLVRFPETLSVTELYNLDRFGELQASVGGRLFQFTNSHAPDVTGYQNHLVDIANRTITIDDGQTFQNPDPIIYPAPALTSANTVRMGDTVTNLTGNVRFSRGSGGSGDEVYRLMPTQTPNFVSVNPRPATPPDVGGRLKVAGFNVLNFFTTLDDGSNDARGADSPEEYDRQLTKLVTALQTLNADVVGLVELENNFGAGSNSAIAKLVDALNAAVGAGTYAYVDPGVSQVGDDAIAVGLIYKTASVQLAPGTTVEVLDDADVAALGLGTLLPVFDGEATNRAPVAASFQEIGTGEIFTLAVNHFKSKGASSLGGSCNDPTADPNCDQGDGQGYWNPRRTAAAQALVAWLDTDPTGSSDPDFLIVGDLNAYPQEDPINFLKAAGYTNLIETWGDFHPYSFVFDGQAGALDYALVTPLLTAQVTGFSEWHINADEPDALDYNLDFGRNAGLFDGSSPFRTSDHDPLLLGLNLYTESPTAVTLASFDVQPNDDDVIITWETGTEIDNAGFNLYRATSPVGPWVKINPLLVGAQGDPVSGATYTFVDKPGRGTFYYRLEDVDYFGLSTLHDPVGAELGPAIRLPWFRPLPPDF